MPLEYQVNFTVTTNWPELVNKRIQQMDIILKEINLFNQAGSLMAKGWFKRQIRFLDYDGRSRKIEDRLHFETVIGAAPPEPMPPFDVELMPDYYIFQPRQLGENQACLQQGLKLRVWEKIATLSIPTSSQPVVVKRLITTGLGDVILNLPLNLPAGAHPKGFNGVVELNEPQTPPVANGQIVGILSYRTEANLLYDIDWQQEFSFLIDRPQLPETGQEFRINATIEDVAWNVDQKTKKQLMVVKLKFQWQLLQEEELNWVVAVKTDPAAIPIKTETKIMSKSLEVCRRYGLVYTHGEPHELRLSILQHQERPTKNGLLLSGRFQVDAYYFDSRGNEALQELSLEYEELQVVEGFPEMDNHNLKCFLEAEIVGFWVKDAQLNLEINFKYRISILKPLILNVITDNRNDLIVWVPTLKATQGFTFSGNEKLKLTALPKEILKLTGGITQLKTYPKNGWLTVEGRLELEVSFTARNGHARLDFFSFIWRKSFTWESLTNLSLVEAEPELNYNSYSISGHYLNYQYLINLHTQMFQPTELKPAILKDTPVLTGLLERYPLPLRILNQDPIRFSMEGELPLKLGNPRGIIRDKTIFPRLNCSKALNAILVEGNLYSEIEYWDDDGYLKQENITYPFWRFFAAHSSILEKSNLIAAVAKFCLQPLESGPRQKGSLRFQLDLEIKNSAIEEEEP